MIAFWVTRAGSFGIRTYLGNRGRAIGGRFATPTYDDLGPSVRLSLGTQIFSALDQLTPAQRDMAAVVWDAHASLAPRARRLNHPRHVLLRFELLTRLHDEGLNAFRVFGAGNLGAVQRFPVFVRHRHRHNGPLTRLLRTRTDLARTLVGLGLRGYRFDDLMIAEFCDTSDRDGLFRKYAAFKVGDRILPCHLMTSPQWCVKSAGSEWDETLIREYLGYIEDNPHEEWLRRVFVIAGVDFGR